MNPSWTATGAGTPEANTDYTFGDIHDDRAYFQNAEATLWLWWFDNAKRYYLGPYLSVNMDIQLYYTNQHVYDLPANPWHKAQGGTEPPPLLSIYEPPPLPDAVNLLCNGKQEPIGLLDPNPTLSWTFVPANGGPGQTAYHIRVATTKALLDVGAPDLWDSGIITTSLQGAIYVGLALPELETHWWAVRVRDANGRWSEAW